MSLRIASLLLPILLSVSPALAEFPFTTPILGENGEDGTPGSEGEIGLRGSGGVPSGSASERNGGAGGMGGIGGNGGRGGNGGLGVWYLSASFTFAQNQTIFVGGSPGNTGNAGAHGSAGSSGGGGGFANWPYFAPGSDGEGLGGGNGSTVTGTDGEDGTGYGGGDGGGGGSSGPSGLVQVMSNGGDGYGSFGWNGSSGHDGNDGGSMLVETTTDSYIFDTLYIGGNGGNGGNGGRGGCGGGGGGGAGGGGTWGAGSGGSGGPGGPGSNGGGGGSAGEGRFIIDNGGHLDSSGTTFIRDNSSMYVEGWYQVDLSGSIVNHGHLHVNGVTGGTLVNYGAITSYSNDFENTGQIFNYGTIDGDLVSSGDYTGTGTFIGNFNNSGLIAPGDESDPGVTHIENLTTNAGTIQVSLIWHEPEMYDQLEITGTFNFAGATLQPEFRAGLDESQLVYGDGFDIIKYQVFTTEEFGDIDESLAPLSQGEWELEYNIDLGGGLYGIRLKYVSGMSSAEDSDLPKVYALEAAYPNPFNPMTTVGYALPQAGPVTFRIYDLAGRLVWSREEEAMPAGRHDFVWQGDDRNGQSLASGTYLLRMQAGSFLGKEKLVLVR